ncbi:MAG: thioredoxin domain-containing protein [Spirochaetota bacterium]
MTSSTQKKIYSYLGILISLVGFGVSLLLIKEYFEPGSACSVGDSCTKVAQSAYSAVRGVPGLGDLPVALFGFVFYSFVGYLFFHTSNAQDTETKKGMLNVLLITLVLGFVVDMVLFAIAAFVIKAVCFYCAITYGVTFALLILTVVMLKESNAGAVIQNTGERAMKNLKANLLSYILVILAFMSCGVAAGKYFKPKGTSVGITDGSTDPDAYKGLIEAYEKGPVLELDVSKAAMIGDKTAPVTIVKYADFNCGHCMHTSQILRMMKSEFGSAIKIYYKHFPLDGNCNRFVQRKLPNASSCVAASASICADEQGKFSEVYHGIYADTEKGTLHSPNTVLQVAKNNGLDIAKFKSCMSSSKVNAIIQADVEEADRLKIESTPTLYINNKAINPGTPDPSFLRALIKHLIEKA